jgi:hypothetical protein
VRTTAAPLSETHTPDRAVRPYRPTPITTLGRSEDLFDPRHAPLIAQAIDSVLSWEAPITTRLLCKRVMSMWQVTTGREAARLRILELIPSQLPRSDHPGDTVIWAAFQQPLTYSHYRVPTGEEERRRADEVPLIELANAALHQLRRVAAEGSQGLTWPALMRDIARCMGFGARSKALTSAFEAAIAWLVSNGRIQHEGNLLIACS